MREEDYIVFVDGIKSFGPALKWVIEKVGVQPCVLQQPLSWFFFRQYVLTMTDDSIERPSQEMK